MEKVSGLPRFSGGWLPPDKALVGAMDASGGGGVGSAPGGLRDLTALLPPGGGGGGGPEDEDAETSGSGGLRLRTSASCAREMASFSVSMPMSTWAFLAASINSFVLTTDTGIAVGTGTGCTR